MKPTRYVICRTDASPSQTMTAASSFRMAVAKEVESGGMRFRDVSFAVFSDKQEPFSSLRTGRKGIIGMRSELWHGPPEAGCCVQR
jgi:hypothetical protein